MHSSLKIHTSEQKHKRKHQNGMHCASTPLTPLSLSITHNARYKKLELLPFFLLFLKNVLLFCSHVVKSFPALSPSWSKRRSSASSTSSKKRPPPPLPSVLPSSFPSRLEDSSRFLKYREGKNGRDDKRDKKRKTFTGRVGGAREMRIPSSPDPKSWDWL